MTGKRPSARSIPRVGQTTERTRRVALIVACALFMQNLDSTVLSTALPTMAHAFGADPVHMNVALTAYLFSLAIFIPTSGWMADRFGTKTVFRAAILTFTLGSILCGRADSLGFLVFARVVQGLGGAMMVPVGRLVLLRTAAKAEIVAAMAWLSMPALIGPVLGPPLGGFIVTYLSWRWIFDINVPFGILGVILVTRFVDDVRATTTARLDVRGLLLSAFALSSLMFTAETIGRGLVGPAVSMAALALGIVAAWLYVLHASRHAAPLLDLTLLRLPTFLVSVAAGTLFRVGIGAIPFLLPLMLQIGFGFTPLQSGLVTFVSSAGAIVMKPAAVTLLRRFGFRQTLLINGLLSSVLLGCMGAFRPSWPIAAIYAVLLFGGFLRSLQFTAFNTLAYAEIPPSRMGAATSFYATVQQVSLTLGITIGAATLQFASSFAGTSSPDLPAFSLAFVAVSAISLMAVLVCNRLRATDGDELSGHAPSPAPANPPLPRAEPP